MNYDIYVCITHNMINSGQGWQFAHKYDKKKKVMDMADELIGRKSIGRCPECNSFKQKHIQDLLNPPNVDTTGCA